MDRRHFFKETFGKGALGATWLAAAAELLGARPAKTPDKPIARRPLGKTGEQLSMIGFGGIVVMSVDQSFANNIVAEAVDRGINYFDIAPDYGDAEEHLGPALAPYRNRSFLACKTNFRDKAGAMNDLDASLKRLKTDHFDLYQHHALTKTAELDRIFGPSGAMGAFVAAQKAGKVRYLGFSCHSVETAIAAMDRAHFDSILFPTNFVLFSKANFGPQVLEHARRKGVGYLAIKAMAKGKYPANLPESAHTPKCWYEPCELPEEASLAYRWTLSRPYLTAAIPPGNPEWFRRAMDVAQNFQPINEEETHSLMARAGGAEPIFRLGNNV
ncbi:MAG TPA: aldo/keto reductase [Terriglobia bacterium]|nr:aldo/keto reductase [Terriglobia bacterium]